MLRRIALITLFLILPAHAMSASDTLRCVQQQLTALGYAPGPADGLMGARTRSASKAALRDQPYLTLPDLNKSNAALWCQTLADQNDDLARFQPRQSQLPVETSGQAELPFVEEIYQDVMDYYQEGWGYSSSQPLRVFGADQPTFLARGLQRALRDNGMPVPRNLPRRLSQICRLGNVVSGITYDNAIALCWKKPAPVEAAAYTAWADHLRMELGALLTHEYFHVIQHRLAQEKTRGRIGVDGKALLGPEWLVEGSAEFFELRYWRVRHPGFHGPNLARLQEFVRESGKSLTDLEAPGTVRSLAEYRLSLLAVELLAARAGDAAIFTYWERLGAGDDRATAFTTAFGIALNTYTERFASLGSSYPAATRFMRGLD